MNTIAEKLNCHGFPDLVRAKKRHEQIIWIVLIALGISLLFYFIVDSTIKYFEYPIMTSISYKAVPHLKFPDVYICPAERINSSKLDNYTEARLKLYTGSEQENTFGFETMAASNPNVKQGHEEQNENDNKPTPPAMHFLASMGDTLADTTSSSNVLDGQNGDIAGSVDGSMADGIGAESIGEAETTIRKRRSASLEEYERYKAMYENETYKEINMRVGVDLEQFLVECGFQGNRILCPEIVQEILDVNGGKCFLVNPKLPQTTAGSGLSLVIRHTETEHIKPRSNRNHAPWARILDTFDPFSTYKIPLLRAGTVVDIRMSMIRTFLLNSPHSKDFKHRCSEGHPDYSVFSLNHTQDSCNSDCYQELLIKECGCLTPVDEAILKSEAKAYPHCLMDNITNCVKPLMEYMNQKGREGRLVGAENENFDSENTSENATEVGYRQCLKKCWQPCRMIEIKNEVTYGRIDGADTMTRDKIIVDIAFGELQVMEVHEVYSFPLENLISDLGGQLGICLGASILTAVQLVVFSFQAFYSKGQARKIGI